MSKLTIPKEEAAALFKALSFKTVDKWDDTKLTHKLRRLPELVDEDSPIESSSMKSLLKTILAALKKGTKVVVGVKEKEEEEEDASVEPKKKKVKASSIITSPIVEKTKKAAKEKGGVDIFGRRLGTQVALIDSFLTNKSPITIEELVKKTKLTNARIAEHLDNLMKEKKLKKTDKGYIACLK